MPSRQETDATIADKAVNGPWQMAGGQILGSRQGQEDAFACLALADGEVSEATAMLLLADGMGGHAAGDYASRIAVAAALGLVADCRAIAATKIELDAVVQAANARVRAGAEANSDRRGMGTTFIAAEVTAHGIRWASVGDSLLLQVTPRRLVRLNADHSMAPTLDDMAERGEISREEAASSASRGKLRSVLRGGEIPLLDHHGDWLPLPPGDFIILASDGLLSLSDDEMLSIGRASDDPGSCVEALLQAVVAKQAPHQDNTTVVVAMRSRSGGRPVTTANALLAGPPRRVPVAAILVATALLVAAVATSLLVFGQRRPSTPQLRAGAPPASSTTTQFVPARVGSAILPTTAKPADGKVSTRDTLGEFISDDRQKQAAVTPAVQSPKYPPGPAQANKPAAMSGEAVRPAATGKPGESAVKPVPGAAEAAPAKPGAPPKSGEGANLIRPGESAVKLVPGAAEAAPAKPGAPPKSGEGADSMKAVESKKPSASGVAGKKEGGLP